eukprot:13384882-Alexandrium_andersonii.AAC.1
MSPTAYHKHMALQARWAHAAWRAKSRNVFQALPPVRLAQPQQDKQHEGLARTMASLPLEPTPS